jgi:hypothetical protein
MDAPGCGTLFIHQLGDCHDGTPDGSCMQVRRRGIDQDLKKRPTDVAPPPSSHSRTQDWFPHQSNITLSRYAFELAEVFTHERIMKNFPGMAMHLFAHSPDAVRPPPCPWAAING